MIYSNKIEKNVLMIKMIENNNINSFSIKLNIDISIIHIFRELYLNIHKNNNYSNTIDNVLIEYKNNQIRFEGSNFEYKINKNQEITDFIDKIITNLMIYEQDIESPRANYV